jgi:predicted regulator of Ras-like GTPase activity (Roadblock/LC7/MglB family)
MTNADRFSGEVPGGFEGGVAGLELAALIQLNVLNRFSGSFRVSHDNGAGLIFFRDGEIVHAEQGTKTGEEAFCEMMAWPRGRFSVEPNVMTALRTIHKRCEHLLLDAHRILDERRRTAREAPTPPPVASAPAAPASPAAPLAVVRALPGVVEAVLLTKDGSQVGGEGYGAEVLAGQTTFVAGLAVELSAIFGAGELRSAAAQGARHSVLVLAARTHHLGVLLEPGADVGAADAAIRNALTPKR